MMMKPVDASRSVATQKMKYSYRRRRTPQYKA